MTEVTNKIIARQFRLLAQLMEFHQENPFKIRSYQSAYQKIRRYPKDISRYEKEQLIEIEGIGKAIADKITQIQKTGEIELLRNYLEDSPDGIVELLQIRGLGPKKVRLLYDELGISHPGELYYACKENRLLQVKGMGAKTQAKLLDQLELFFSAKGKCRLDQADELWEEWVSILPPEVKAKVSPSGAFRRRMPVLERLDAILPQAFVDRFCESMRKQDGNELRIEKSDIYFSFRGMSWKVHTYTDDNYGAALWQSTGGEAMPSDIPILPTEEEIFNSINLPFIPPALRDHPHLSVWLSQHAIGDLVQATDIKGMVHMHTDWSDGGASLHEMVKAAHQRGYEYVTITDHSKAAFYANGLNEERLLAQKEAIDAEQKKWNDIRLLRGCEVDILHDGTMDLTAEIRSQLDIVIASIHSQLRMDESRAMQRLIGAIEDPNVHMLGHPTGRLLLSRAGYPIDHHRVIDACAANGVSIEINANPMRLDLDWTYIPYCMEKGVMISINPDAHSPDDMNYMKYGVDMARKGGLIKSFCINCLSANEFLARL